MKLLFDQNISYRITKQIIDIFPESKQVRELGLENHTDKSIWEFAKEKGFTIVTFDGDFYDFSLIWGYPPQVIWIRSFNQTTKNIEKLLRMHHLAVEQFILEEDLGCIEIYDK